MDFQNYTKEQLIAYIQKLEKNSDITYEDRMKLLILDGSPLTLWASDRDCRIKLWLCKSESLYGFSTEEAMGSDFVDLFVSKDERMQARLDQIKIIDNGEEFHNLAFDVAKSGNTLKLLTVCRRIEDPITGERWNAEIGIIIDFYEKELNRLHEITENSREIERRIKQFEKDAKLYYEQMQIRYENVCISIRKCEEKAIRARRRSEFKEEAQGIRERLEGLYNKAAAVRDRYTTEMRGSTSIDSCDTMRTNFTEEYNCLSGGMEQIALDVYELETEYSVEETLVSEKDSLLLHATTKFRNESDRVNELCRKVEEKIGAYNRVINAEPGIEGIHYKKLIQRRDAVKQIQEEINTEENRFLQKISHATSKKELEEINQEIGASLNEIKKKIHNSEKVLEGNG